MFYLTDKIAIAIDGKNTFEACRSLGYSVDFKALRKFFGSKSKLTKAMLFTTTKVDENGFVSIQGMLDWMEYNGYCVVAKPVRQYDSDGGKTVYRGSTDVDLAVAALSIAPQIDHLILFSGNGDFAPICIALQDVGVRVTVISTIKTSPPIAADILRRAATDFIDLQDITSEILKEHTRAA